MKKTLAGKLQSMFVEQYEISQIVGKSYRRIFLQSTAHFGLTVWYDDNSLEKIIGFQLGYKPNSFNTDDEYLLTIWPDSTEKKVEPSCIRPGNQTIGPASKVLSPTEQAPPSTFAANFKKASKSLPVEIQNYLNLKIQDYLR